MRQAVRLVVVLLFLALPLRAQQLELRFLDVGQGDAILIREGGKTALVDAGHSAGRIIPYLATLQIHAVDLIIATHKHADHIGGMPAVLGNVSVRYYVDNGIEHRTGISQRTLDAVERSGAQFLLASDRTIRLGDAQLRVLAPLPEKSQNNASVGLLIEYGNFRALLTGDAEVRELRHWLATEHLPRVQIVKVSHHGARNGTIPELVEATRPEVAVISVGAANAYGHPSPETIERWSRAGAQIHRTDLEGTILILASRDGSFRLGAEQFGAAGAAAERPSVEVVGPPTASRTLDRSCCKVCSIGKACGNSCISRSYACHQPPGCACDASP